MCCKSFQLILALAVGLAVATAICACGAGTPSEPTLNELSQNTEFQQCLVGAGVPRRQISECLVNNPNEESARACIQAHSGEKSDPKSIALYRCYHLQPETVTQAKPPSGQLNCYGGMMGGVTCR
jgi:hypothetical protein